MSHGRIGFPTRKSSTKMRAQRASMVPPRLSTPPPRLSTPPPPFDPMAELAMIVAELSPHGVAGLLAHARKLRDDEKRRGASPPLFVLSPRDFASRVEEAASASCFGVQDCKVFVAALFRALEERGETSGLGLSEFKARLLTAHQAGLLVLSRCESGDRADPATMTASEIRHLGATFHMIRRTGPVSVR